MERIAVQQPMSREDKEWKCPEEKCKSVCTLQLVRERQYLAGVLPLPLVAAAPIAEEVSGEQHGEQGDGVPDGQYNGAPEDFVMPDQEYRWTDNPGIVSLF